MSFSRASGSNVPSGCTSATSRWNEFDPRSSAAMRMRCSGPSAIDRSARYSSGRVDPIGTPRQVVGSLRAASRGEQAHHDDDLRVADADRREARSRRRRRDLRQHQPRDRGGHRPGRRRERRRHGPRHRRRPAGLRRDRRGRPTGRSARRACSSCKDALDQHKEELRPQIVAEVGTPIGLTYAIQQDTCIDDMQWDIDLIDRYEWEYELGDHEFFGMRRTGWWSGSRSASWARSRRGTSRSCSTSRRSRPRSPRAAR